MAKAKRPRKTKQNQIDEAVELLGKIEKKEAEVEKAAVELEAAREATKTKKGVWLTKVDELRELCRTRKRWAEEAKRQPLLTPKKPGEKPTDDSPLSVAMEQQAAQSAGAPADSRPWQTLPINTLGLSENVLAKCGEKGVLTLGDFQAFQAKHGDYWSKELGLRSNQVGSVTDAWERLWNEHPEWRVKPCWY